MNTFVIEPSHDKSGNIVLSKSVEAFYHGDYCGGGRWKEHGTLENMITNIKNDKGNVHPYYFDQALQRFRGIYNHAKQAMNPMFDLNRAIAADDARVVTIDSANMRESLAKLVCQKTAEATLF